MKKKEANILIVDDDIDVLETARMFLKQEFTNITIENSPKRLNTLVEANDYDVILLDMNFKKGLNDGSEGFYWLTQIKEMNPDIIVILITAYGEVDLAVKAMKLGATDFVLKPWKNQKLMATIYSALELRKSKKKVSHLQATQEVAAKEADQPFKDFIGESPEIQRIKSLVEKVAVTDANVLILGENGTGKEVVARALHRQSDRSQEVFISVDLGSITASLFESELFGYMKGAFTDAKEDRPGRFELAHKGTIFLDEIGNLSLPLQSKLLTVLQSKTIRRVGSSKEIKVDFRLICATNMPLYKMVERKEFRQDLLYRINTVEMRLPSLQNRSEDIPALVNHFVGIYGKKYHKENMMVKPSVFEKLKAHAWAGNIRELQHAVERAIILSEGNTIDSPDQFINRMVKSTSLTEPMTMDEMERDFILSSLEQNQGNVTKTAEILGLTRTAMYRRMKKHGI